MSDHDRYIVERAQRSWREHCPPRFRDYRLDTSPQVAAAAKVSAWLDGNEPDRGGVLLIFGPTGTGKTGLAVGAMYEWLMDSPDELPPLFVNAPRWLDDQRPGRNALDPMTEARTAPLLVLDDIGAEMNTDWAVERYYLLLNDRYEEEMPTIVTTNLADVAAITAAIGERVMSRLAERITLLHVSGSDLRARRRS